MHDITTWSHQDPLFRQQLWTHLPGKSIIFQALTICEIPKNTEIQLAQATKRVFQNNFRKGGVTNLNVQHRHGGAAHRVMVFSETSLERQELFDLRDMSVHLKPALCHIKGHLCILAKVDGLQVYKEHVTCRIRHLWLWFLENFISNLWILLPARSSDPRASATSKPVSS